MSDAESAPTRGHHLPSATWARTPVVAGDLDALRGPTTGVVVLPLHLEASARTGFDLADPARRRLLYEVVLGEATTAADLQTWLDRDALIALWPVLYLPRAVRGAWQQRHRVLRERGAGLDVPRPR